MLLLLLVGSVALPALTGSFSSGRESIGDEPFVLAAYADGPAVSGHENAIFISDDILSSSGWSQNEDGSFFAQYTLNPDCLGTGIKSIEYRSTNENVMLQGERDRERVQPDEVLGTAMRPSIVVGGDDATMPDLDSLKLCVTSWPTGADGALLTFTGNESEGEQLEKDLQIERAAVQELSSGTLEITATFEDGSTATHIYRITPVDNFDEIWHCNRQAFQEAANSGAPEAPSDPLLMLEQLE